MMVNLATKNGLAIVTGSQESANVISNLNKDIKIIRLAEKFTIEIRGQSENYPNGVLIDESVKPELIRLVTAHGFKIRGGFVQNYKEKGE
jgi:hypothetical protein